MSAANDQPFEPPSPAHSGPDSEENVLESPSLVTSALDSLRMTIDRTEHLLQDARSSRSNWAAIPTAGKYGRSLSSRERRELDQAVDSFWADFKSKAEQEFERLEAEDPPPSDDVYPYAPEVLVTDAS